MSRTPPAPGRFRSTWPQIHLAPSASTVIDRASLIPSRAAARRHCGPRASLVRMPAVAARAVGAGSRGASHPSRSVTGSPASRLAKMLSRISRQPSVVLAEVPSVWNSTSPFASRKAAPAAGSSRCQARIARPWRSRAPRTVLSQTCSPASSRSSRAARSNDISAPARQSRRCACGLTGPTTPSRSSSGWTRARQARQAKAARRIVTSPAEVTSRRSARP